MGNLGLSCYVDNTGSEDIFSSEIEIVLNILVLMKTRGVVGPCPPPFSLGESTMTPLLWLKQTKRVTLKHQTTLPSRIFENTSFVITTDFV